MTGTHFRAGAIACALLASTAITTPALAQVSSPVFRQVDDNGVDLVRGDFIGSFVEGSIGSGEGALTLTRILPRQMSPWDGIRLEYVPGNGTFVDFGTRHDKFPGAESRGSTLTAVTGGYHYTTPDGTVIAFINNEPENGAAFSNLCRGAGTTTSCYLVPTSITSPNGEALTLAYEYWQRCDVLVPEEEMHCDFTPRLKKVTNSHGYSIEFSHSTGLGGGPNSQPPANFYQRTSAKFFNNAVSATVPRATVGYAYPSAGVTELTDMDGRVWRFTSTSSSFAIRRPGAASNTTTYNLSSGVVTSVVREGITTSYNRAVAGSTITMTVTDAASQPTVVTSSASVGRPSSVKDPLNRTTNFQYDGSGRLTRTTLPEANYVQLTYDTRGNVTETRAVSKTPNTPADIVTTASYPVTCANAKTCNKPEWTRDARLNQTDYTYDSTHGGVLTVTAPSPSGGPVRPQTRYSYTLTNGEYLLTGVSACATGSAPSCVGTADEVKSTAVYDARGNLTSTSSGNGSGTLTATSVMTYDEMGNLLTVDGPLAGSADAVRYRYNAARELIGTVSADPDGAGPLKHRASRTTITNGLVTRQERGTVDSQSDAHWAAFDPTEMVDIGYDAGARPVTRKLSSDTGTAYALSQTSYDAVGRPECAATRMNPAVYGSLPASACLPGTEGSFGKDRIAKTVYNNAGEVTEQRVAVGVAGEEAVEASFVYTANGKLFTLKDAENNLTSYIYDGHDRLSETRFASATKGAGTSNPADNEVLTYDATGNVTNRQLRDDQSIAFTYDNLNRVTLKNLPGSEPDVSYAYDLLGRLTSASQTGHALSFTYDALGRNLTQAGPQGTVTSEWDLAGRRTKLTYPGSGLYLDYDYLVTGEMAKIRENGATSGIGVLATFGYDDLGRRSSLTFGNGASQAYAFDPVSRLF